MEDWLMRKLDTKLQNALSKTGVQHAKLGILDEQGNLNFSDRVCNDCNYCLKAIQERRECFFRNRGCFPEEVNICLSIPFYQREKSVGLVITEEAELSDNIRQILQEIMVLVGYYSQSVKINKLSVQQWGEKKAVVLIGGNPIFRKSLQKLEQFARSDYPVLITGESGVGKELFAKSLYLLSQRRGKPFISVNCGQFQDEHLLVSELFGHKKGSFTGASENHAGIFVAADGGVVFLDEVGDLTVKAQAILLRTLSEGEIKPLGGSVRTVNVRVIAATNRELTNMIEAGNFRKDLYYRLSHFRLSLPPVRERLEDLRMMIDYYLDQLNQESKVQKKFSKAALSVLMQYNWPGNVRELKSIIGSSFSLCENGIIEIEHFINELNNFSNGTFTATTFTNVLIDRMVEEHESFWKIIKEPFLKRELNRSEVHAVIQKGLEDTKGSYKKLLRLFNLSESDYLKFMDFLRHHRLKPSKIED